MSVPAPHFLLRARANRYDRPGRWSFMLEAGDGSQSLEVEDDEPDIYGERLELLALVRGLEAVPQPARVTVVASSPYVNRVLNGGLDEWRACGWQWERHGEMVPIKNADLWRRVDRALTFHVLDCRSAGSTKTSCRVASGPTAVCAPRAQLSRCESHFFKENSTSARRLSPPRQLDFTSPPNNDDHRKSLSRKALALFAVLRRRIRATCRNWRHAVESLAEDESVVRWAE